MRVYIFFVKVKCTFEHCISYLILCCSNGLQLLYIFVEMKISRPLRLPHLELVHPNTVFPCSALRLTQFAGLFY